MTEDVEILVPEYKYNEMIEKMSTRTIVENGRTMGHVVFKNKKYVITSGMSSGKDGWICVGGYEMVEKLAYRGDLTPLHYCKHFDEVSKGNRKRSYNGLIIKDGKIDIVLIGNKITFKQQVTNKQLEIF